MAGKIARDRSRRGGFPFLVGKEEEYPTIVVGWNPLIGCKKALGLLVYFEN